MKIMIKHAYQAYMHSLASFNMLLLTLTHHRISMIQVPANS